MGIFDILSIGKKNILNKKENFKRSKEYRNTYDIKCPFCFKTFNNDEVHFRVSHDEDGDPEYEKQIDEVLNEYNRKIGKATLGEINAIVRVADLTERNWTKVDNAIIELRDNYDKVTRERLCPHCHNLLPITSGRGDTKIISVIGASQAGKSVYMTCLLYYLEHHIAEKFKASIIPGSSEYNEDIKQNQRVIFEFNKMLEPTPKQHIDPLIETFKFKDDSKKPITFVFYDVPGEGMTDKDYIDKHGEHIQNSDGIIFLIDPLQMRTLRKKINLANKAKGDFTDKYQEPKEILVYLFENFISKQEKTITDIPTAVVVTKSDMLVNLNDEEYISENSNAFRNCNHDGIFNLNEFENIDGEIRRFLTKVDTPFKGAMDAYFKNTGFFAVSSLGCNPENCMINSDFIISPLRIEEPFLWLLYQMGYIKGGRE
ncbi:TRAFAC clade GTPase domain-containing protein [Clostridium sp.]